MEKIRMGNIMASKEMWNNLFTALNSLSEEEFTQTLIDAGILQCSCCSCHSEAHENYYFCPIFNNYICDDCCDFDMDSADFVKKYNTK